MGQNGSWIWKALLISAGIALLTWFSLFFFFKIHQESNVQPAFASRLSAGVFVLSTIICLIYFRMRMDR
ncbi:MAG TPA: hypothetical protein VE133_11845 [Candidatus Sulfotelmatobacter sp.]|nr:hypothetical protein [Candidatus Sulfotelmatobacter sp.]